MSRILRWERENWQAIKAESEEWFREQAARLKAKRHANPEHFRRRDNAYMAKRRKIPTVRLVMNLRGRLAMALKGRTKAATTMELCGCSLGFLKLHLEGLFTVGMNWSNYGLNGWHIDHIRPCASFDLSDPEQQRACFHWTNLQPLWAADNLRKSDTWQAEA